MKTQVPKKAVQIGDQVRLMSGSVTMTVERILLKKGRIVCVWFDERTKVCRAAFPAGALMHVPG